MNNIYLLLFLMSRNKPVQTAVGISKFGQLKQLKSAMKSSSESPLLEKCLVQLLSFQVNGVKNEEETVSHFERESHSEVAGKTIHVLR